MLIQHALICERRSIVVILLLSVFLNIMDPVQTLVSIDEEPLVTHNEIYFVHARRLIIHLTFGPSLWRYVR